MERPMTKPQSRDAIYLSGWVHRHQLIVIEFLQ
jgi:hypothetical protein